MDLKTQEKISKLIQVQAEKLGKAITALKKIKKLQYVKSYEMLVGDASKIASDALEEITKNDKNIQDL